MDDELDFLLDLDGDAGALIPPTMRGDANLDAEDYTNIPGVPNSSILDDDLQEDTPSRPQDGPAPAFDVDGLDQALFNPNDAESPDMLVTQYGSHPWGPGSGGGYRPYSMNTGLSGGSESPSKEIARRVADQRVPVRPARQQQFNQEPSNADIDPATLYDRSSFEYDDDPQNVIGDGIFDMEEGVTWRARDGIFQHGFALPAYIAHEGEMDTAQSEMWDSTANEWRVVQPNASGVSLMRRVAKLKPEISPFVATGAMPSMHADAVGPHSHIEAFGRKAAKVVVDEAKAIGSVPARSAFISAATEALGPGMTAKCRQVSERLVQMGWRPDTALEDTLAHCVMHATMNDLMDRRRGARGLPRIDKMGAKVKIGAQTLRNAAAQHLAPIATDASAMQSDVTKLTKSPAAMGMGQVVPDQTTATPAPTSGSSIGMNLLIAAAVLGAGYVLMNGTNEGRSMQRNARRRMRRLARKVGVR